MNLQQLDWQTIVALMIVSVSLLAFAKKIWNMIQPSKGGCGTGCSACPTAPSNGRVKVTELIQLKPGVQDVNESV